MPTKMTSGVLCRDKNGKIAFFLVGWPKMSKTGLWEECHGEFKKDWSLKTWNALYQLYDENGKKIPPPKPGECYEVEIQL